MLRCTWVQGLGPRWPARGGRQQCPTSDAGVQCFYTWRTCFVVHTFAGALVLWGWYVVHAACGVLVGRLPWPGCHRLGLSGWVYVYLDHTWLCKQLHISKHDRML